MMTAVGALALTCFAASNAAGVDAPNGLAPSRAAAGIAATPIEHVVIIYQENHTFDDTLGAVCASRSTPCDGYTGPVELADGNTAPNIVQPDVIPLVKHDPRSQKAGVQNRWNDIEGCTKAPYPCVSHVDPAKIPNLAALANTFAVSDATFAAGKEASFGAHVELAAGTPDGFLGYNPVLSKTGEKPGPGWGCPSNLDALWGPNGEHDFVPSCIPDKAGNGPYRASPVAYRPTVMERLETAGLSWHIYQGQPASKPAHTSFSFCTYFAWCLQNRFNLQYNSSTDDFVDAAAAGTLPNLSVLIPTGGISQHNGTSMSKGDNYVGSMVQAAMDSPQWNSTAVFITYDDCGCFYDHVLPPGGLGLRNPMVVVSPWAKAGSTDSTVAVQPYSMLTFVQHSFDLDPLSREVSRAYDYADVFDFSQRPLQGIEMTRTAIPRAERQRLAELLPMVNEDPT